MATDEPGKEILLSLPVRWTRDGREWGEGIATSLSTFQVGVQSIDPPTTQSRVFVVLGLGDGGFHRGEARVTSLGGAGGESGRTVSFGLKLDDPPSRVAELIGKIQSAYPGPLSVDSTGRIQWPIGIPQELPDPAASGLGFTVWTGDEWFSSPSPSGENQPLNPNRPLPECLSGARALGNRLIAASSRTVVLGYQGLVLVPVGGVPRILIADGLAALEKARGGGAAPTRQSASAEPRSGLNDENTWTLDLGEPDDVEETALVASRGTAPEESGQDGPSEAEVLWEHPFLELVAIQVRIIDTLGTVGWRYQQIEVEVAAALERDRAVLEGLGLRLSATAEESFSDPDSIEALGRAIDEIGTFIGRAVWHSHAFEPLGASQSSFETWQIEKERLARQAVIAARAAQREPEPAAEKGGGKKFGAAKKDDTTKNKSRKDKPAREKTEREKPERDQPEQKPARKKSLMRTADGKPVKVPMWLVGLTVLSIASALISLVRTVEKPELPPPPKTFDLAELRQEVNRAVPGFPLQSFELDDKRIRIVVGPEWSEKDVRERQAEFEKLVLVFVGKSILGVAVASPDGIEQAHFRDGQFVVRGVVPRPAPTPEEKTSD